MSNRNVRSILRKVFRKVFRRMRNSSAHWQRRIRRLRHHHCYSQRTERLSVVLLSYKRPRNIDKILSSLVLCDFIGEIILSNNNPLFRIEDFITVNDPRLRTINQPERRYASVRMEVSLTAESDYILAIDDDIFLQPEQIRSLFEELVSNPSVPHGVRGEIFSETIPIKVARIKHKNQSVDALVWLFAYTRSHALKYFRLLDAIQIDNQDLDSSEDVPLSFAGESYARVHDIGPIHRCPTENTKGIATCQIPGFMEQRISLVLKMRHLQNFNCDQLVR